MHFILVKSASWEKPYLRVRSRELGDPNGLTEDGTHLIAIHPRQDMSRIDGRREVGGYSLVSGQIQLPADIRALDARRRRTAGDCGE